MSIGSLLRPDLVICNLEAPDRRAALAQVVDRLVEGGYLSRRQEFLDLLMEREELMSTGVLPGIAIPHPRRAVPGMFAESLVVVAVSREGVDFQGAGGVPTSVMLVICAVDDRSHLRILSRLSRLIDDDRFAGRVLSAESPEAVIAVLADAEHSLPGELEKEAT